MNKFLLPLLLVSTFTHATPLDKKELKEFAHNNKIQHAISGEKFQQDGKDYYLIFSKRSFSQPQKGLDDMDFIEIKARFLEQKDNGFATKWVVNDGINCPSLDISADFIPEATTFNQAYGYVAGNPQVSIGYKLFCGGGVDPKILKIIYYDNNGKVALRGSTQIYFSHDKTKIGGQYEEDKVFKNANLKVQTLLKSIWKNIYIENY